MKRFLSFAASAAFLFVVHSGHMVTKDLKKGILPDGVTYRAWIDEHAVPAEVLNQFSDPAFRESIRAERAKAWKTELRRAQFHLYGESNI